ncbi:MAG: RNA polymerase sigma factor [Mariniblastus sp.]
MKSTPETRYTLIGKIRDPQDAEAWSEFTAIYQPLIFRIARKKGLQHADATDVTQEVLSKVASAIEKFDGTKENSSFRGWLYRITRNLVIDFIRKRSKHEMAQIDDFQFASEPSSADSQEFYQEFQKQIFYVVATEVRSQVKPKTWQAFWETEMERKSVDDVAKELNMSPGAIYVARSRVLARLKSEAESRINASRLEIK